MTLFDHWKRKPKPDERDAVIVRQCQTIEKLKSEKAALEAELMSTRKFWDTTTPMDTIKKGVDDDETTSISAWEA